MFKKYGSLTDLFASHSLEAIVEVSKKTRTTQSLGF